MAVTYTLSAFKKAGFVGGHRLLRLETEEDPEVALAAFEAAIGEMDEAMANRDAEELWAMAFQPLLGPDGPVSYVEECEPLRALEMMLEHVAEGLTRRGVTGVLRPARPARLPKPFDNVNFPATSALLLLHNDVERIWAHYDSERHKPLLPYKGVPFALSTWPVDRTTTRAVLETVGAFVRESPGSSYLTVAQSTFAVDPPDLVELLIGAVQRNWWNRFCRASQDASHRALFETGSWGSVRALELTPSTDPGATLPRMQQVLRDTAEHVNAAFIAPSYDSILGERDTILTWTMTAADAPLASILKRDMWLALHLEHDYVHNVFACQVMTDSQLAKTADLPSARWTIEPLGHGRHLVSHTRPDLWLDHDPRLASERENSRAQIVPDDVLAQAREDFGEAIMTLDTLRANPPGLSEDDLDWWWNHLATRSQRTGPTGWFA